MHFADVYVYAVWPGKGCGKTYPDPAGTEKLDDGVVVPCGKSFDNSMNTKSSLLYNEVRMRADHLLTSGSVRRVKRRMPSKLRVELSSGTFCLLPH